jgi:hypothetical protein
VKFRVSYTSGGPGGWGEVEIETLEQLLEWILAEHEKVVIFPPDEESCDWEIEVYDDYRE